MDIIDCVYENLPPLSWQIIVMQNMRMFIKHKVTPSKFDDKTMLSADVVQSINSTGKLKIKYTNRTGALKKDIGPEKQLAILRIIQEQFNNILKHANATEAILFIDADDHEHTISLEIRDNGQGFEPSSTKKGLGLNNMFNRVAHYNGSIELISSHGKGCTLHVKIPV